MAFNIYLALTISLIVLSWIGHLLEYKRILYIHESSVGIMIGVMIGAIGKFVFDATGVSELQDDFFFNVLLPPIIFSAAYSLKKKSFFDNFGAVMVYGIIATLLTFGVIFVIVFQTAKWEWFLDLKTGRPYLLGFKECLQVAAVFSSTDSVSALSILHPMEFPTLHSILAGEGIINDGISIIIFNIVIHAISSSGDNIGAFIAKEIFLLTLGSAFVGICVGLANALFIKYQPHEPQVIRDMCIVFLFAYTAYEVAEALGLSGIIAIFFCGIIMTHYTWHSFSKAVQYSSLSAAQCLGFISEAFLFICLGAYVWQTSVFDSWSPIFSVILMLSVVIARLFSVFCLTFILNLVRTHKITPKMQLIITWAGLARGALAFVLCLQIRGKNRSVIVTSTLSVAIFSSVFLSSLSQLVIKYISGNQANFENNPINRIPRSRAIKGFKRIDNLYLKPFFRKNWEVDQKEAGDQDAVPDLDHESRVHIHDEKQNQSPMRIFPTTTGSPMYGFQRRAAPEIQTPPKSREDEGLDFPAGMDAILSPNDDNQQALLGDKSLRSKIT